MEREGGGGFVEGGWGRNEKINRLILFKVVGIYNWGILN